ARHGRVAEALKLCEGPGASAAPDLLAYTIMLVGRAEKATAAQRQYVERWLKAAARTYPKSQAIAVFLGDWLDVSGHHGKAMVQSRRALAQGRNNQIAQNNLAFLLALKAPGATGSAEALKLIQAAIDEAGPHPELLDTRAVVHLAVGKADLAFKDLL